MSSKRPRDTEARYDELVRVLKAASAPPQLAPGERLGEYEVQSLIARGGAGEVYRARQLGLGGRLVALKILPTHGQTASERERFERGARLASNVHHAHLIEVYGFGEEEEGRLLYFAMRLAVGPTLADVLQRLSARRVPPEGEARRQIVERCAEVAEAIGALGRAGLVHRDVKPANVVVEGGVAERPWEGHSVLVDFGLIRDETWSEAPSSLRATVPYAPREVLLGERADARADVYGLGASLHDLLTARTPERRRRPASQAWEPLRAVVPGVDRALDAIVRRSVAVERGRRYRNGDELAEDLRRWLEGRRPRPRGRWRVAMASALLSAAIAVPGHRFLFPPTVAASPEIGFGLDSSTVAWAVERIRGGTFSADLRDVRRLAFELPARSALELAAAEPAADAALAELMRVEDGLARLELWTVLSGWADGRALPVLSVEMVRAARERTRHVDEELRLAWTSVARIVRRAEACGYLVERSVLQNLIDDAATARIELERRGATGANCPPELSSLFRAAAFSVRRQGFEPLDSKSLPESVQGPDRREVQAASEDPDLRAELERDACQWDPDPASEVHFYYHHVGRLVGGYTTDREALESRVRARVRQHALESTRDPERAESAYARGLDEGRREVRGEDVRDLPDPSTLLWAADPSIEPSRPELVDARDDPISWEDDPELISRWTFEAAGVALARHATGATVRDAGIEAQPEVVGEGFCLLGTPGRSELRLTFDLPSHLTQALDLVLDTQKSNRRLLPFYGTPTLDLEIDGRSILRERVLREGGLVRDALSIGDVETLGSGPHEIVLRLSESSETPLRVYGVRIVDGR